MMQYAATRAEAKKRGDSWFYTGKPCKWGHDIPRPASTGACPECARNRASLWYANNKERANENMRRRYYEDPQKAIDIAVSWQKNNATRRKEICKKWRHTNPDKATEAARRWRHSRPDLVNSRKRSSEHRRRSYTKDGIGAKEMRNWESQQAKVCFYCDCECEKNYHVDHVYPLSKGGEHQRYNLAIACPSCNSRKGNLDPEEFINRGI